MSKEMLKNLIDLIDDSDTETIYKVLIRFIPETIALPDEVDAIAVANESITKYDMVSHEDIDWD